MERFGAAALSDALREGVIVVDHDGRVAIWNGWVADRSRIPADQAVGSPLLAVFGVPLDSRVRHAVDEACRHGRSSLLSYALHPFPLPLLEDSANSRGGERIRQSISISPIHEIDGPRGALIHISDVSETLRREQLLRQQAAQLKDEIGALSHARNELARSQARFRELALKAPAGIWECDASGRCIYVNDRWCQMTGLSKEQAAGFGWMSCVSPTDVALLKQRWEEAVSARSRFSEELRYRHTNGREFWVRSEAAPLVAGDGALTGYIGTAIDITQAKQQAQMAEFRANHDTLTGLPNRTALDHHLEAALRDAGENDTQVAVLFLDLDRFKQINDELGHAIGDRVLQISAERLRATVRASDVVARWGGDEFVVVLTRVPSRAAIDRVMEEIERITAEPIDLGGVSCQVGSSIGLAVYPEDRLDPESLLKLADSRMYECKRSRQAAL